MGLNSVEIGQRRTKDGTVRLSAVAADNLRIKILDVRNDYTNSSLYYLLSKLPTPEPYFEPSLKQTENLEVSFLIAASESFDFFAALKP